MMGGILTFLTFIFCLFLLYAFFIAPRGFGESAISKWVDLGSILIVVVVFAVLLLEIKMIRAPLVTVGIDQRTDSVDIIRQRFYGKKAERFYFHQIEKFKSYKGKLNFSQQYFLALVLANRKTLKLKIPVGADKLETTRLVKKLNKFVKSKKAANEFV
jgi:hypothetical protein